MKKVIVLLIVALFGGFLLFSLQGSEKGKIYSVAFYNVENLFDTIHDKGKNDLEYLPDGFRQWDREKYSSKLTRLATVLSQLSRDKVEEGPAVIGIAEVENYRALQDLISEPLLAKDDYQFVHYEGPDKRGIDCALLYNPKLFTPTASKLIPSLPFQGDTIHKTRGFLVVRGTIAKEQLTFIVNHWPSRGAPSEVRVHAAQQVKAITDSLYNDDKNAKIVIMGDLNDDPMDESVALTLGAKKFTKEVKKQGLYNPWWEILEDKGVGTLMYRGEWNLFDQIIISQPLLKAKKGLRYKESEVFMREYLFQTSGKYKGSPLRTFGGKEWLDGYSDHLPTILYLEN